MIFLWLEKRVPLWKKSGKMRSATSNTYALKDEEDMQLSELKKKSHSTLQKDWVSSSKRGLLKS